uniref:Metalloendopeptidase n=1 Tax=Anopheles atroparvus TaxID=41427 RepID=A0A182JFQ4_ANOAO
MASKNFLISALVALGLCELALAASYSYSYSAPSVAVGKRLKGYNPKTGVGFAHEYGFGHYYQGDIILRPTLKAKGTRLVLTDDFAIEKWPNATVPYVIKGNFTEPQLAILQAAMDQIAAQSCVRFIPRTTELIYVSFTNADEGCYAYVGRSPFNQYNRVNLQTPECMTSLGTPVHEMLHTIGFFHEFTRDDRDEYVTIDINNLLPEYQDPDFFETNFGKVPPFVATTYGVKYNYGSVMHYSRYAGAADLCCPVLSNLKPYFGDFGSETGLTPRDAQKINVKYCGITV